MYMFGTKVVFFIEFVARKESEDVVVVKVGAVYKMMAMYGT